MVVARFPLPCSLRFITSVQGAASLSTGQMRKTLIPELAADPTTALRQLERLKKTWIMCHKWVLYNLLFGFP